MSLNRPLTILGFIMAITLSAPSIAAEKAKSAKQPVKTESSVKANKRPAPPIEGDGCIAFQISIS